MQWLHERGEVTFLVYPCLAGNVEDICKTTSELHIRAESAEHRATHIGYREKREELFFDGFFDLCYQVGRSGINFVDAFCMFHDLFHQFCFCRGCRLER